MVVFIEEELQRTSKQCNYEVVGKFLEKGFQQISPNESQSFDGPSMVIFRCFLFEGFSLFWFPSKEVWSRILERGPWSLVGQLLTVQYRYPSFKPTRDSISIVNIQLRPPDLSIDIWDKYLIMKFSSKYGKPKFLDNWTSKSTILGFAHVRVSLDLTKPISSSTTIQIRNKAKWIEFVYEDLPDLSYSCGKLQVTFDTCNDCSSSTKFNGKQLYGPQVHASIVPVSFEVFKQGHRSPNPLEVSKSSNTSWQFACKGPSRKLMPQEDKYCPAKQPKRGDKLDFLKFKTSMC